MHLEADRRRRIREAVLSLNSLARAGAGSTQGPQHTSAAEPTSAHLSCLSRICRRVSQFDCDPVSRSDSESLYDLLKTRDFYSVEMAGIRPYDEDKVAIFKKGVRPLPLRTRLPASALAWLEPSAVERTATEMDSLYEQGELTVIRPHWDARLRFDASLRHTFLQRLRSMGLGTLRRRIKGKIGFFFREKKNLDLRMIVDARGANQAHRRPPHSRLGTPASIGSLDLSPEGLGLGADSPRPDLHVATVDLRDSF